MGRGRRLGAPPPSTTASFPSTPDLAPSTIEIDFRWAFLTPSESPSQAILRWGWSRDLDDGGMESSGNGSLEVRPLCRKEATLLDNSNVTLNRFPDPDFRFSHPKPRPCADPELPRSPPPVGTQAARPPFCGSQPGYSPTVSARCPPIPAPWRRARRTRPHPADARAARPPTVSAASRVSPQLFPPAALLYPPHGGVHGALSSTKQARGLLAPPHFVGARRICTHSCSGSQACAKK